MPGGTPAGQSIDQIEKDKGADNMNRDRRQLNGVNPFGFRLMVICRDTCARLTRLVHDGQLRTIAWLL